MLPWKLRKCQILPVSQNLSSVYFSPAKFQLVSCNLFLATIWQMTYTHKLPKLCSATLTNQTHEHLYSFDKLIKSLYFCSFVVSETVLLARFYFKVIRKWLYTPRNCSWPGSLLGTRRSVRYWPIFFLMSLITVLEVLAT